VKRFTAGLLLVALALLGWVVYQTDLASDIARETLGTAD
jgi:hypothetical protein